MHQPYAVTGAIRRVSTDNSAFSFRPFTDWIPAQNVDNVRSTLRMFAELNSMDIKFAYQTATVVTDVTGASFYNAGPNAWTEIGTAMSANGLQTESHTIGGSTSGNFLVRFGIAFKSTTGGTLAEASVGVDVQVEGGSIPLGAGVNLDLHAAPVGTGLSGFTPVSGWLPAAGIQSFQAGILKTDLGSGNVNLYGVYQIADDPEFPGAWTRFTNIQLLTSGATVIVDPAPVAMSSVAWYRLGVEWNTGSGSQQQTDVNIAISGVYL